MNNVLPNIPGDWQKYLQYSSIAGKPIKNIDFETKKLISHISQTKLKNQQYLIYTTQNSLDYKPQLFSDYSRPAISIEIDKECKYFTFSEAEYSREKSKNFLFCGNYLQVATFENQKLKLGQGKELKIEAYDKFTTFFQNGEHVLFLMDFNNFSNLGLVKVKEEDGSIGNLNTFSIRGFDKDKFQVMDVFWLGTQFVAHSYGKGQGHFLHICSLEIDLMVCKQPFKLSEDLQNEAIVKINPMNGNINFLGKTQAKIITLDTKSLQFNLEAQFPVQNLLGTDQKAYKFIQKRNSWIGFGTLFFEVESSSEEIGLGIINFRTRRYHVEYSKGKELNLTKDMVVFSFYKGLYSSSKIVYLSPVSSKVTEITPQLPALECDFTSLTSDLDNVVEVKFGSNAVYRIGFKVLVDLFDEKNMDIQFNQEISGYADSLVYSPFSKFNGNMVTLSKNQSEQFSSKSVIISPRLSIVKFQDQIEDVQDFSNKCLNGEYACFYQGLSKKFYIFGSSLGNTEYVNFNLVGIVNFKNLDYNSVASVQIYKNPGSNSKIFAISKLKNAFQLTLFSYTHPDKDSKQIAEQFYQYYLVSWSYFKSKNEILVLYLVLQKDDKTYLGYLDLSQLVKDNSKIQKFPESISLIGNSELDPELKLNSIKVNLYGHLVLGANQSTNYKMMVYKIGSGYQYSALQMRGVVEVDQKQGGNQFWLLKDELLVQKDSKTLISYSILKSAVKVMKTVSFPVDVTVQGKIFSKNGVMLSFQDPAKTKNRIFAILDLDNSKSASNRIINPFSIEIQGNQTSKIGTFYIKEMNSAFLATSLDRSKNFKIAVFPLQSPIIYIKSSLESEMKTSRLLQAGNQQISLKVNFEAVSLKKQTSSKKEVDLEVSISNPTGIQKPSIKYKDFVRITPKNELTVNIEQYLSIKGNIFDLQSEKKDQQLDPSIVRLNWRQKYSKSLSFFQNDQIQGFKIVNDLVFAWSNSKFKILTLSWEETSVELYSVDITLADLKVLNVSTSHKPESNDERNLILAVIGQQENQFGHSLILLKIESQIYSSVFTPGIGELYDLHLAKVAKEDGFKTVMFFRSAETQYLSEIIPSVGNKLSFKVVKTALCSNQKYRRMKLWSFIDPKKINKLLFAFFFDNEDPFGKKQKLIIQQIDPEQYTLDFTQTMYLENSIQLYNLECPDVFNLDFTPKTKNKGNNPDQLQESGVNPYFICYYAYSSSRIQSFVLQKSSTNETKLNVVSFAIAEGMPLYIPISLKFNNDQQFMVKYKRIVNDIGNEPIYFSVYNLPEKLGPEEPTPIPCPIGENDPLAYTNFIFAPRNDTGFFESSSFYKQFQSIQAEFVDSGNKIVVSRMNSKQQVDYLELNQLNIEILESYKFITKDYQLTYDAIDKQSSTMKSYTYNMDNIFIQRTKVQPKDNTIGKTIWTVVISLVVIAILVSLYIVYRFYERKKDQEIKKERMHTKSWLHKSSFGKGHDSGDYMSIGGKNDAQRVRSFTSGLHRLGQEQKREKSMKREDRHRYVQRFK